MGVKREDLIKVWEDLTFELFPTIDPQQLMLVAHDLENSIFRLKYRGEVGAAVIPNVRLPFATTPDPFWYRIVWLPRREQ